MKLQNLQNLNLIYLGFFVLFPACIKQDKFNASRSQEQELEARLFDIPIPINRIIKKFESEKIQFFTPILMQDVVDFYLENLEIQGWNLIQNFSQDLLYFEKPNKYLSILFEPNKKGVNVTIFLKFK